MFIAACEDDRLIEIEVSEQLVTGLPGARGVRYRQGGHNLQKTWASDLAPRILLALEVSAGA